MERVFILHMTHIGNLPSLREKGYLFSDAKVEANGIKHQSIGHAHIKERRKKVLTPIGCSVAECVPFYFWGKMPMLYALFKNAVDGYTGGNRRLYTSQAGFKMS